jgi:hypothetical protein
VQSRPPKKSRNRNASLNAHVGGGLRRQIFLTGVHDVMMDSSTCSIHIDGHKEEDKPIDYVSMETLGHIRSFAGAKHDADG